MGRTDCSAGGADGLIFVDNTAGALAAEHAVEDAGSATGARLHGKGVEGAVEGAGAAFDTGVKGRDMDSPLSHLQYCAGADVGADLAPGAGLPVETEGGNLSEVEKLQFRYRP